MTRFWYSFRRFCLASALALTAALGLTVLLAGVASAHASYVSSDPAAGAVLAAAPTKVTVHFAENVDPQGSSLMVYHEPEAKNAFSFDADAKVVSTGQSQVPLSDSKSMTIAMTDDGNGVYGVVWKTVSADDGDTDNGVFFFGVGVGNVLGNSAPTVTPGPTTASSRDVAVWVPILVGILALLVGGGLGAWLARRVNASGGGQIGSPAPRDTGRAGKS
jgi:methionine-rich copper-binding protein CopC